MSAFPPTSFIAQNNVVCGVSSSQKRQPVSVNWLSTLHELVFWFVHIFHASLSRRAAVEQCRLRMVHHTMPAEHFAGLFLGKRILRLSRRTSLSAQLYFCQSPHTPTVLSLGGKICFAGFATTQLNLFHLQASGALN